MNKILIGFLIVVGAIALVLLSGSMTRAMDQGQDLMPAKPTNSAFPAITLAGGCFWCTESEYRALDGVLFTRVGYMGGALENPTYKDISTGDTGHAEVVEVTYDPAKISEEALIEFFLTRAHDPTQLNRQGVDVGTQYRSAIFYEDDAQKQRAQAIVDKVAQSGKYKDPIVTTLEPRGTFWVAEDYHQQYYEKYQEETGVQHIRVMMKQKKRAENP
jgi:peptide-methionine (S)-S-oxide reductase